MDELVKKLQHYKPQSVKLSVSVPWELWLEVQQQYGHKYGPSKLVQLALVKMVNDD